MHKSHAKRRRDIKNKLMAAICMLLVSSIMMVSTTYAWFTLSTAPEVTGINTAVGANGNLEMALMPKDGQLSSITSEAGDSTKDIELKNVTWGNLVDVSNTNIYGLDKITLYPSELNLTDAGKIAVDGFMLKTPTYGADGRVDKLTPNAQTGNFDKNTKSFYPGEEFGVRAVGSASGMTPRQLSYRNARSAANTARALAANQASASLNENGSSLANIAIKYGTDKENATFGKADVEALRAIIDDLNGTGGVLDQLETAYMQYILAYAASAANTAGDVVWQAIEGAVTADGATLSSVTTTLTEKGLTIPAEVQTGINEYNEAVTAVNTADTKLQAMEQTVATDANATIPWDTLKEAMTPLANPGAMKINGYLASEVKDNLGAIVSSVTEQGGLKVIMESGAGVYADIADQCGDYSASVTIEEVTYSGITLNNMTARMETKTSMNPVYLVAVGTAVEGAGAPEGDSATALPISDTYGYIIDLAFRTNATDSKLLLQQEGVDRIYDNNTNEETMGHGSSMTFMATTTDFSNEQVKALMDAIKIIFFNPTDGTIYCYAGLDTANATIGADGVTAEMYLYKITGNETTYRAAQTGETATHVEVISYVEATVEEGATYVLSGDNYVLAGEGVTATHKQVASYREATADETATHVAVAGTPTETEIDDNAIMALTQNTATALSVLVYLDGNLVDNSDVAATGTSSMTGTMNLQFASSANLVPMEYADLHIPGAENGDEEEDDETTTYDVTVPTGVTGNATATAGQPYEFTVATGYTLGTVTVGGTEVTPDGGTDGKYTIPADKVTGAIVITVTDNANP